MWWGGGPCSRKSPIVSYSVTVGLIYLEMTILWDGLAARVRGICSHAGGQCVVLCRAVLCCGKPVLESEPLLQTASEKIISLNCKCISSYPSLFSPSSICPVWPQRPMSWKQTSFLVIFLETDRGKECKSLKEWIGWYSSRVHGG